MVRRLLTRVMAVIGIAALAGCAGTDAAVIAPPGVPQTRYCGTVNIAVNPWAGYAANAAVVSYLLKNQLNCQVNEAALDERSSWAGLNDGTIDVILEHWGNDDLKKKYIDRQKVAVELGVTGNKGRIGWFVPTWMTEEYPDIVQWKNLNKYADLFKTAKSGKKGQFLGGDPSYTTNDENLIKNLKLNYTVVYAGTEDKLVKAFQEAQENRTPLLGYFFRPQWLLTEEVTNIPLPPYTPGCDSDKNKVTCDYPPYELDKIGRKKFVDSGSPAATFIRNWQWTNADQNQVARDIVQRKMSPEAAAKKWVDAHRAVWEKWLP